jgi:hypothetical protein
VRERKKKAGVRRDAAFNGKLGGKTDKFTAVQVPRQCPFVLLVNVD